jgi:hypothetical protein
VRPLPDDALLKAELVKDAEEAIAARSRFPEIQILK